MKFVPMDYGAAGGGHLAISHTVKHYLDPAECWDDIAQQVPAEFRPRSVLVRLSPMTRPVHTQSEEPSSQIRSVWSWLGRVHDGGYFPVVARFAEALPEPLGGKGWRPSGHDRWIRHGGGGIVMIVGYTDEYKLVSAFRMALPTRDADKRDLDEDGRMRRRRESERRANQYVLIPKGGRR